VATLALLMDGVVVKHFSLDSAETRIGRKPDNDIRIEDLAVSGHHAVIERVPNRYLEGVNDYFLRDAGSTNGTLVNGEKIQRVQIRPEDCISIGWNTFRLIDGDRSSMDQTAYILPGNE